MDHSFLFGTIPHVLYTCIERVENEQRPVSLVLTSVAYMTLAHTAKSRSGEEPFFIATVSTWLSGGEFLRIKVILRNWGL